MSPSEDYVTGDKNAMLKRLLGDATPGSVVHEAQKMAVIVRCTEDLEGAVAQLRASADANAAASTELGKRVFWLNVVLTAATVVTAAVAFAAVMR